jgi:hypothetical protein
MIIMIHRILNKYKEDMQIMIQRNNLIIMELKRIRVIWKEVKVRVRIDFKRSEYVWAIEWALDWIKNNWYINKLDGDRLIVYIYLLLN